MVEKIKPATTPSRRIDRSAGAICVLAIVCLPPSLGVAREAYAVIGVAQVRRQRRAVRDRAPRIGVTPGPAATDAPRPGFRPSRVPRRGADVVLVVEPVGAPLGADPGDGGQPRRVDRRFPAR